MPGLDTVISGFRTGFFFTRKPGETNRYCGSDCHTQPIPYRKNGSSRSIGKWGVIGIGGITKSDVVYPHYTFGVSYELLEGLSSNFEYVMTPDETAGVEDHLRLALSINF